VRDRIRIKEVRTLSDNWALLRTTTFDWLRSDGAWHTQRARPTTAATASRCCPTIPHDAPCCW